MSCRRRRHCIDTPKWTTDKQYICMPAVSSFLLSNHSPFQIPSSPADGHSKTSPWPTPRRTEPERTALYFTSVVPRGTALQVHSVKSRLKIGPGPGAGAWSPGTYHADAISHTHIRGFEKMALGCAPPGPAPPCVIQFHTAAFRSRRPRRRRQHPLLALAAASALSSPSNLACSCHSLPPSLAKALMGHLCPRERAVRTELRGRAQPGSVWDGYALDEPGHSEIIGAST